MYLIDSIESRKWTSPIIGTRVEQTGFPCTTPSPFPHFVSEFFGGKISYVSDYSTSPPLFSPRNPRWCWKTGKIWTWRQTKAAINRELWPLQYPKNVLIKHPKIFQNKTPILRIEIFWIGDDNEGKLWNTQEVRGGGEAPICLPLSNVVSNEFRPPKTHPQNCVFLCLCPHPICLHPSI